MTSTMELNLKHHAKTHFSSTNIGMSKVLLQIENLKPTTIRHNLLFMQFESDSVTLLLMDEIM
jgi:hypothetical protein